MTHRELERFDSREIVGRRNCHEIGEWSLLYNGQANAAEFGFTQDGPHALRIAVSGSSGWVRLVRPVVPPARSGVFSVSLSLSPVCEGPGASVEAFVFVSPRPNVFEKHSRLTETDGTLGTRLHITADGPEFWIGFETREADIELCLRDVRFEVIESGRELARKCTARTRVERPLVTGKPLSERYAGIEARNGDYSRLIARAELPFLLDYASQLRGVEMPDTFLRLIRYLVVKHAALDQKHRGLLARQVRNALILTHDRELVELVYTHCPEMLPTLDLNEMLLGTLSGLENLSIGHAERLDPHAFFVHQEVPRRLLALVHPAAAADPDFLRTTPDAYCALANAYAVEPGREGAYLAYTNKYLEHYRLPHVARIDPRGTGLGRLVFDTPEAVIENGPLVSVLMSAHQSGSTIGYAIESLLAQTYRNVEVLVCDDGSEDDTLEVARAIAGRDPRVRVFASAANQGTYNIRNALLEEARGDFVTFQDSDDFALPCRIEDQLDALIDGGAKVCFTHWIRVRPDGRAVFFFDGRVKRFCVVSAMAHRSLFDHLPPFRTSLVAADTEFHEVCKYRFGEKSIRILPRPLLLGLWGEESLTRRETLTADHSGYVAPARRAYADIAARQRLLGDLIVSDAEVEGVLRECGIYRAPAGLAEEVTGRSEQPAVSPGDAEPAADLAPLVSIAA